MILLIEKSFFIASIMAAMLHIQMPIGSARHIVEDVAK